MALVRSMVVCAAYAPKGTPAGDGAQGHASGLGTALERVPDVPSSIVRLAALPQKAAQGAVEASLTEGLPAFIGEALPSNGAALGAAEASHAEEVAAASQLAAPNCPLDKQRLVPLVMDLWRGHASAGEAGVCASAA